MISKLMAITPNIRCDSETFYYYAEFLIAASLFFIVVRIRSGDKSKCCSCIGSLCW
jgi:hypothetical protein